MSYAEVIVASADTALSNRIILSLREKAYTRIDNLANGEDQRERQACLTMFRDTAPTAWVSLVLLLMDANGTLLTVLDSEIDAAVTTAWNRIKLVG
jgi:hypothetical protein